MSRRIFGVKQSTTLNGDNYGGWNKLNSQGSGTNYNLYHGTSLGTIASSTDIYAGTPPPTGRAAWIVGNSKLQGYSHQKAVPTFTYVSTVDNSTTVLNAINRLPGMINAGKNNQTSVVNAWKEVYRQGYWVWMQGSVAPLQGISPLIAYDFQDNSCYNGQSSTVTDLSGNRNDGTITSNIGRGQRGSGDRGRVTAMRFDGSAWINVSNNIVTNAATGVTYTWSGQRSNTNSQYVFDARNGGGTWFLTEYAGYDYNWGNRSSRFNNSNGYQDQHFGVATATDRLSAIYYNGTLGAGAIGNSGTNNATVGRNLRIGTRYTNSSRWNMWMSSFMVYNSYVDQDWAEVLWLHNRYRVTADLS